MDLIAGHRTSMFFTRALAYLTLPAHKVKSVGLYQWAKSMGQLNGHSQVNMVKDSAGYNIIGNRTIPLWEDPESVLLSPPYEAKITASIYNILA